MRISRNTIIIEIKCNKSKLGKKKWKTHTLFEFK